MISYNLAPLENSIEFHKNNRASAPEAYLLGLKESPYGRPELTLIQCKTVTIWNRIKAFFGCGPLARIELHIKEIGEYVVGNWNINLGYTVKQSEQAVSNVLEIAKRCGLTNIEQELSTHQIKVQEDREKTEFLQEMGFEATEIDLTRNSQRYAVAHLAAEFGLKELFQEVISKIKNSPLVRNIDSAWRQERVFSMLDLLVNSSAEEMQLILESIGEYFDSDKFDPSFSPYQVSSYEKLKDWAQEVAKFIQIKEEFASLNLSSDKLYQIFKNTKTLSPEKRLILKEIYGDSLNKLIHKEFTEVIDNLNKFTPEEFTFRWEMARQGNPNKSIADILSCLKLMEGFTVKTIDQLSSKIEFILEHDENQKNPNLQIESALKFLSGFFAADQNTIIELMHLLLKDHTLDDFWFLPNLDIENLTDTANWLIEDSDLEETRFNIMKNFRDREIITMEKLRQAETGLYRLQNEFGVSLNQNLISDYIEIFNRNIGLEDILNLQDEFKPFLSLNLGLIEMLKLGGNRPLNEWVEVLKQVIEDIKPILVENYLELNICPLLFFSRRNTEERTAWVELLTQLYGDLLKDQAKFANDPSHALPWKIMDNIQIANIAPFVPLLSDFMNKSPQLQWESRVAVFEILKELAKLNESLTEKIQADDQIPSDSAHQILELIGKILGRVKMWRERDIDQRGDKKKPQRFPIQSLRDLLFGKWQRTNPSIEEFLDQCTAYLEGSDDRFEGWLTDMEERSLKIETPVPKSARNTSNLE